MPNSKPYILTDRTDLEIPTHLDDAWNDPTTFVFLAEKSGISRSWVEQRLSVLPPKYHRDHFILLTSGSTGRPKLVVGARARAKMLAETLHELQQSEPLTHTICSLPLTYCYAFVNQWLWTRHYNRTLTITRGLAQPNQLKVTLQEAKNSMLCLVGAQASMLVQYYNGTSFPGIQRVHFAGGRFPQERFDDLCRLFPKALIFNNYGCAEAMPRLTLRQADQSGTAQNIGRPLPGVELRSDDDHRLLFRSKYGAVALIDEERMLEIGQDTWVPTGDLGVKTENGDWEVLGREGEVFKRYGEKVSIPQIVAMARTVWKESLDAYREKDGQGEEGYVLVLAPAETRTDALAILKLINKRLPRTHWPLRIEGMEQLPLLTNGKIDRVALKSQRNQKILWKQHF